MTTRPNPLATAALFCLLSAPAIAAPAAPGSPAAEARAVCDQHKDATPLATDAPDTAQRAALAGCDGEALLYGIGRPADLARARLCAFHQQAKGENGLFSGAGLLMTIYANGMGVPRNLPVAVHLACDGVDSAPAELWYRVPHLAGLGDRNAFSPCDDITSGESSAVCARHEARLRQVGTQATLDRFAAALPAPARPAFAALRAAQANWAEARATNEVDRTGSAEGAFVADEQRLQDYDFASMLTRLRSGRPPALGAPQLRKATARIDAALPKLMAQPAMGRPGEVTAAGIRVAQQAWRTYRDAWGRFAAIAYPGWGADGAEAWVGLKRADMLEHLMTDRG